MREECELSYEVNFPDLAKGEQFSDWFREMWNCLLRVVREEAYAL
jgi:hypothetical protein